MTLSRIIPILGIFIFSAIYFYAATLYPGGTKWDHATVGYDHLYNYWCDLFDAIAYNGVENPARTIALVATVIFPASLLPLVSQISSLFKYENKSLKATRIIGCLSLMIGCFMPLSHDLILNIFVGLAAIASLFFMFNCIREKKWLLLNTGLPAFICALMNFLIWHFAPDYIYMPLVQKFALVFAMLWIGLINYKLAKILNN